MTLLMKTKLINRYFDKFENGEHLSRKGKKCIYGKKLNKSQLKKLIARTKVVYDEETNSKRIFPYEYCPNCGCTMLKIRNHHVSYPEVWIDYNCARCGTYVGGQDNSPVFHILENYCYKDML